MCKVMPHTYDVWPVPQGELCEMHCTSSHTYFCVWSPQARQARVSLYEAGEGGRPIAVLPLEKKADGTFRTSVGQDLRGRFYTFRVQYDNGRWSRESPGIFAKAVGVNGQRAQVLDLRQTDPEGWERDVRPAFVNIADAVLYELHLRDFSMDAMSGIRHRGKYLALTERGTKHSKTGETTGLDHLVELGVTHVQLLPCSDFCSIDERNAQSTYNWGYDPQHFAVPEGSYSTDPYTPAARIREFKRMVMALHQAGIRVVMDVVFNHVGDMDSSNLQRLVPGYFFRTDEDGRPSNGSGCGNETASERQMMRKLMIESVLHWVKEYHVDGFRFDLMGLHDVDAMNAIRKAVNVVDPTILIYGEGWTAAKCAYDEARLALKTNMRSMPGVAAFGDELRDALRGPWADDGQGGFLMGMPGQEESVKYGLAGACTHQEVDMNRVNYSDVPWANVPTQMISYVSCHDDLCLADRVRRWSRSLAVVEEERRAGCSNDEACAIQKLGFAAVMASRGVPFFWCGDEVMRNRKGVRNCYRSPDAVNCIHWALKRQHKDVFLYLKELIALRKRFRWQYEEVLFLPVKQTNVVAALYGNRVLIVLNSNRQRVQVDVPAGEWNVVSQSNGKATVYKGCVNVPEQCAVIAVPELVRKGE